MHCVLVVWYYWIIALKRMSYGKCFIALCKRDDDSVYNEQLVKSNSDFDEE